MEEGSLPEFVPSSKCRCEIVGQSGKSTSCVGNGEVPRADDQRGVTLGLRKAQAGFRGKSTTCVGKDQGPGANAIRCPTTRVGKRAGRSEGVFIAAVPFYIWAEIVRRGPGMDHVQFDSAGMKGRPNSGSLFKAASPLGLSGCKGKQVNSWMQERIEGFFAISLHFPRPLGTRQKRPGAG